MDLSSELPVLNHAEQFEIKQINLNNYYKNDPLGYTHCEICKIDIPKVNVFEHTIAKRHKYNKLFVGIIQGNYLNKDIDFIVLNRDKLKCRYCNFVTINSVGDDITSHIKNDSHKIRRKHFLDRNNTVNAFGSAIDKNYLKPLDSLITLKQKNKIKNAQVSVCCETEEVFTENELPKCIIDAADNMYKCTVCAKKIPHTITHVNQHINGKAHKFLLQRSGQSLTIQERKLETPRELPKPVVTKQNPTYTCATCRKEILNATSAIQMHNLSDLHSINVRRSQASVQSTICQRANVNHQTPTASYRTPTASYEKPTVSYQRPTVSYQRPTVSYRSPTSSYFEPVRASYDRPQRKSECNIL